MNTIIASLLQVAAATLMSAQHGTLSVEAQKQVILNAEHSIQVATQALNPVSFPVAQNASIWPTTDELMAAPYRAMDGSWVKQGNGVVLLQEYTSFGDLNADGKDDAAVIVRRTNASGAVEYDLAAMLNQGGIMFNIADRSLGGALPQITAHHVQNGAITLDNAKYELFGNQIVVP